MLVIPATERTNLMTGDLAQINRASVNGRAWMSTAATILRTFEAGERVELLSDPIRSEGRIWARVRAHYDATGAPCYVATRYLDLVEARASVPLTVSRPEAPGDRARASFRPGDLVRPRVRLKLRAQPNARSTVLRELSTNTLATVLDTVDGAGESDWIHVQLPGVEGWLATRYIELFGRNEKWIEVDISNQTLIAWNDREPDARLIISSGKPGFRTPLGAFTISQKVPAKRTVATVNGEHWDIPGVPWIMVFRSGGYYIHGVYWHEDFGSAVSHGCVTLAVPDAEWLYQWTPLGAPMLIHE